MFVGSFDGDFIQTPVDIAAAFDQFHASGVTNLVIDVTDNEGLQGFMDGNAKQSDINDCRRVGLPGIAPPSVPWWCDVWNTVGAPNVKVRLHLTAWYRGFESASRANPLAQKILETVIARRIPPQLSYYASSGCELP
jgi:hypothetical protein